MATSNTANDLSWMWWRKPPQTLPAVIQTQSNGSANGNMDWMWWRTPPTTGTKGARGWPLKEIQKLASGIDKQKKNPLSDVANWQTGGRKASDGNGGGGNMMWMYAGGALLVAVLLMRRKK